MKTLHLLAVAGLTTGICAQQTLTLDPTAYEPGAPLLTYSNSGANFFDLVVDPLTGGITLHGLEVPTQEPVGVTGTIEIWINVNGGTHVGVETLAAAPAPTGDPSGWELLSSGAYTAAGFNVLAPTCQTSINVSFPSQFIPPGTWPMAIVYVDVDHEFYGVQTYPAPAGTFADTNVEITSGATQAVPWTVATLTNFTFNGVNYQGCLPNFGVTYSVGSVNHSCAESELIGTGSGANVASFFDLLEATGAGGAPSNVSAALQGTSLEMTNTGQGYSVTTGNTAWVNPGPTATALAPADNAEPMITLPNLTVPIPTDDGLGATTANVWINTNGYISFTGATNAMFPVPVDPQGAMDGSQQTLYAQYHDYNSSETGSGPIVWEEDLTALPNPVLRISWDGVESFPNDPANPNPSRMQISIDLITGNISVVYDLIDPVGGSTQAGGDDSLIGWTPAGDSPDVPESDYTTLGATPLTLTMPETMPLMLTPSGQPTLGANVDLVASNLPAGQPVGVIILDTTLVNPPTPLFPLGAPMDAGLYVGNLTFVFTVSDVAPQITVPVPTGVSVVGSELIAQSAWLDIGQVLAGNLFTNLQTSNAVRLRIGIF